MDVILEMCVQLSQFSSGECKFHLPNDDNYKNGILKTSNVWQLMQVK